MWTHPEGELDVNMPTACPRTWEAASDYIVDQILEDDDAKYKNLCDYGKGFIVEELEGIIGKEVAQRFADFVSQFSLFTSKDAENVSSAHLFSPFFTVFPAFFPLKQKKIKKNSIFFKKRLVFGEKWGKRGVKRGK